MYNVYSNEDPLGKQCETAEEAWKALRAMKLTDVPQIEVMLNVGDTVVSFCAASWYSVIYTGMDQMYNLTDDEVNAGIAAIDALVEAYHVEQRESELAIIGSRDLVFRNKTESINGE